MKKIAITQRIILNKDYNEVREALDVSWGAMFEELDFLPVILPYNYDFTKFEFDGVILSGGNDIGEVNFRDEFEYKLIEHCITNDIPLFGLCRGMQIIAKYFKGSFKKVENQVAIKHKIIVNKKSIYKRYLDKLGSVNSYHNNAVDLKNDNFIISAWNEDKTIIKAIEHKSYKIFAQMWHSEREEPFNQNELELIRGFFK